LRVFCADRFETEVEQYSENCTISGGISTNTHISSFEAGKSPGSL
jgi:hypothetical protein